MVQRNRFPVRGSARGRLPTKPPISFGRGRSTWRAVQRVTSDWYDWRIINSILVQRSTRKPSAPPVVWRRPSRKFSQTGWPAIDGLMELPWRGTPALTRRRVQVAEHRLFAVGDTTGYVEPFTGEGMAWALRSAVSLAGIVDKAIDCWHPRYVGEWNSTHLRLIGRKQYLCRWMSWLLRSPRLTRWLVGILSAAPVLAHPYLRLLNRGATHNS